MRVPAPTEHRPRRRGPRRRATLALLLAGAVAFGATPGCSHDSSGVRDAGPVPSTDGAPAATAPAGSAAGRSTTTTDQGTTTSTATFSPGTGDPGIPIPSTGGGPGPGAAAVAVWTNRGDAYLALGNGACSVLSSVAFWADDAEGWAATRRVVDVFASLTPPSGQESMHRRLVSTFRDRIDTAERSGETMGDITDPTKFDDTEARTAGLTFCVNGEGEEGRGYSVPGSLFDDEPTLDDADLAAMVDWELALRDPYQLLGGSRSCVRAKALAAPETVRDNLWLSGINDELGTWAGECGTTVKAGYNYLEPAA